MDRIERLMASLTPLRRGQIPVGVEKARLVTESFARTEGWPTVRRVADAFKHVVRNATLRVEPDQLLLGNPASQPLGVELTHVWGLWPESELDALRDVGFILTDEDRATALELNEYWQGRTLTARMAQLYDDHHLWPYAQTGLVLPAFRSRSEGWGAGGMLGGGYGIQHEISQFIGTPDYGLVLREGIGAIADRVRERLDATRLFSADDVERRDHLTASLQSLEAVGLLANRLAELAGADADDCDDPARAAELRELARICAKVPRGGAETFHEAVQAYWLLYVCMLPSGVLGMGRVDQLLAPWYERDIRDGRIDEDRAVELLACLRVRDAEVTITGGQSHRSKWAGGSKWHNATIGGVHADGSDATNDVTHLLLEAAARCPVPHHTLSLRVHPGTPDDLLDRAVDLASTGIGMPAFVGDPSFVRFLLAQGVDLEGARDYDVSGSLSATVRGRSRVVASPMFVTPRVLELAVHGGVEDLLPGAAWGGPTLEKATDFASFLDGFADLLVLTLQLQAEFNNVTIRGIAERFPRPLESVLMDGGIDDGRSHLDRTLPYENGNMVNPIGIVNVVDGLLAIDEVVFRGDVSGADLAAALRSDWAGETGEELRQRCLAAPRFGSGDPRARRMARRLFAMLADRAHGHRTTYGGVTRPSALTIGTSFLPGGATVGATPDGRRAGDPLAEASLSPASPTPATTAWTIVEDAAEVDHDAWQTTELDLRLDASTLATGDGRREVRDLIRWYLLAGGKHVQLDVVDRAAFEAAMTDPASLAQVRLGGTTSYVAQLGRDMQDRLLSRPAYPVGSPSDSPG